MTRQVVVLGLAALWAMGLLLFAVLPVLSKPLFVVRAEVTGPSHGKDCADFWSQADAQRYFLKVGGPNADPDHLDGDRNGIACQTLPTATETP